MSQISKRVRDAIVARLADGTYGFNTQFAAIAGGYGLTASQIAAFTIDWTAASKQFFQGKLSPEDIDDTTASKYPLVFLYTDSIRTPGEDARKFQVFSGDVVIGLDVWISTRAGNALRDFETFPDAVEDAVLKVFNDPSWTAVQGGGQVFYNGQISADRTPVDTGAENWLQGIRFRLIFGVDV